MRPTILMVSNFLTAAGYNRGVCEDLAYRLRREDWQVITTSNRVGRISRLIDMVATAWMRRLDYSVAQVDVYSGSAFIWAEAVTWVLKRAGKPYILTLHGGNLPTFARRWPGRVKRLLKSAQVVTTPSRYLQEQMQAYRADLRLIPNPIEIDRYPFQLRNALKPRLVWLRAFCEIYNPTLAPRVIANLKPRYPSIHLIMVGPDKGDGSLQRTQHAAKSLGVEDAITWTGGVLKDDVPSWLNKGDIFINTTNIDNTPVSVMEAMACGLCVVSTNVGGIPYLLEHGENGLLVPPDDAEAMSAAIIRLLNDSTLATKISSNAREEAEAWDWSVILPKWDPLFQRII